MNLGTNPYDKLKFDRQLQTMVDRILPEVADKDLQREREFYEKRGIKMDVLHPQTQNNKPVETEPEEPMAKKIKVSELKRFYSDEITFALSLDQLESEIGGLKNLDKPYIRTSAKVTVKHIKKYIEKKLNLDSIKDLEITYRGEVLGNEHSLEYILKTRGLDPHEKNPRFVYRTKKEEHLLF